MPNWCYTKYTVSGSKESIEPIYKMLKELESMEKPRVENGFGKLWLGCIIDYLGGDWHNISCRGDITDYTISDDGTELILYTQIAWAESPEFRHFLERKCPGISIMHYSEEPGCAGYWTNDPDYPDKYLLDSCFSEIDSEYFEDLYDAVDYLSQFGIKAEPTFESISHVVDEYSEEKGEYLSFREIEYIND